MSQIKSLRVVQRNTSSNAAVAGRLTFGLVVLVMATRVDAQNPGSKPPAAPVLAEAVQQQDVVIRHTFVGTVTPTRTSVVGSMVEGQVIEFRAREGDFVRQGETLAQLRLTKLKIQLAGAVASQELLKSQLEDLRVSLPIEVKQAQARKQAADALQEYASRQYERGKNLGSNTPVTTAELDELKSSAAAAVNIYGERAAALELTEQTLPAKIAQAEARLRVQEETINELKDAIDQHTIAAPFDGYITKEQTEVGQWITKGGPVAEIVELTEVDINLPVLETHIAELRARSPEGPGTQTLDIIVDALPGEKFSGDIVAIVPQADYQARTFPVKVRVVNRMSPRTNTMMLKPGMFARVELPVHTVSGAIMIPKDALVLDRSPPTVWVVMSPDEARDGTGSSVRPVSVEIDEEVSVGNWVQVVGPVGADGTLPLKAGDVLITEGNERVNPRANVIVTSRPSID